MTTTSTEAVANRLCEMLAEGRHVDAMRELYADDARQIEAMSFDPNVPRVTEGKEACIAAAEAFGQSIEVHSAGIGKPYPHDDQFIVEMWMDTTFKEGPMAGQRFDMREMALYTVRDGQITEAKFFYGGEK